MTTPGTNYGARDVKDNTEKPLLNVGFGTKPLSPPHSLAHHVTAVLVCDAVSPVAAGALVHLALGALEARGADALHAAVGRNRARLGVHAVVVANI